MENPLFILGAADVEMQAIESLLKNAGLQYVYAVGPNGERCHPGNAYRAIGYETIDRTFHDAWNGDIVWVECGGHRPKADGFEHTFIDHHHPGDSGYGKTPDKFMEASSIGQIISLLATNFPHCAALGDFKNAHLVRFVAGSIVLHKGKWVVGRGKMLQPLEISDSLVMVAAADHCLGAAYKGQCPGVNPDELMAWRAKSRAKFQKRSVAEVLADVEKARQRLREAITDQVATSGYGKPSEYIGNGLVRWDNGSGYMEVSDCDFMGIVADLRGEHVPELPEAAAREGIPFLASMTDRDGRKKVSIMGAGESLVRKFLAGELVPGLVDYYGCEKRGFAGGYIK